MKESNCHDPKMEAYCTMVRSLEDKFDGLELNHIARKFNEAVDELAKMASARTPVPPNVFARDLHKPSVDYASATEEENHPVRRDVVLQVRWRFAGR